MLILHDRKEQTLLAAELSVERRQGAAGKADDIIDAGGFVAVLKEDFSRGLEEGLAARQAAIGLPSTGVVLRADRDGPPYPTRR